jgi:hypothetical protein
LLATLHKQMDKEVLAFVTSVFSVTGQHVTSGSGGKLHIEVWQAINLIGAPLLALLFAGPVIEDLKSWWTARKASHLEDER